MIFPSSLSIQHSSKEFSQCILDWTLSSFSLTRGELKDYLKKFIILLQFRITHTNDRSIGIKEQRSVNSIKEVGVRKGNEYINI